MLPDLVRFVGGAIVGYFVVELFEWVTSEEVARGFSLTISLICGIWFEESIYIRRRR